MFLRSTDSEWKRFGDEDPYFGVLTQPRYRKQAISQAGVSEFFESGEIYVNRMMQCLRQHFDVPAKIDRALDYGCGVGRLMLPLTEQADFVEGVDVSPGMLREAGVNLGAMDAIRTKLTLLSDWLADRNGQYELVHTFIVLQHIPSSRGVTIFRRLVDAIADGGFGVIHVVYANQTNRAQIMSWLRKKVPFLNQCINVSRGRKWSAPAMQMNPYKLQKLFRYLQERGVAGVYSEFTNHGGQLGVTLYFQKPARPTGLIETTA